ncbi:hypothetical protein J5N97_005991 [Dioscorea zingiberensis]|uniref:RING-type E3 ubiquitin transferase n=1 Tax=Dioscorea zingiberensis TaxID=325984 RepID=A0A9D5D961_9LILI|nr:hypothetical protein J5N97_005991 [Dioscorea zingiberensis]
MDAPAPPTAAVFSGFLPTASLLESLVHTSREIISMEELPSLQTRNVAAAVRRTKLLSSLFEEIRDSSAPLPLSPPSILGLTELLSVIRRTKSLIDESFTRSTQWRLVQTELVSREFHVCVRELARALDILPLSLIGISGEVGEQVELLHKQAKRAQLFVDPKELRLREELLQVMANGEDHEKKSMRVRDILWSIGLRSVEHCQEEMLKLEDEAEAQAGTGGLVAISIINNLLSLLSYAKSVIYHGDHQPPPTKLRPMVVLPKGLNRSTSWSVSSSASSLVMNVPDEFRCPISLELMKEPVILASGHTYDRSSIARWINSGHHSCPKTGQKLIHMALIPNYALKSLINQWCKENNVPSTVWERDVLGAKMKVVDHISATREATEAVRMTAEIMVGKLAVGSPEIQRQAAYELRLLAKTSTNNRRIIAEAGAIPFLVNLLRSGDPRTQENAVTALHNLSILENNKSLIMAAGAIDAIIEVLREGVVMEARENAAATMFSLSMVDDQCKVMIGARPGAITGLVELLQGGTAVGKKDAAKALMNLVVHQTNRGPVVAAGTVAVLVGLLMDEKAGITDEVLVVLAILCACEEGLKEIGENRVLVAILVELMRFGSPAGKENSIALLLGLCRDGGEEMGRRLLMNPRSVPSLQSLAADGSPKARRKAGALLRLLNRCCSHSQSRTPVA